MGTRSLTIVYEEAIEHGVEKEIAVLYRQFDGYLDGMGKDIAKFLKGKQIVNGYSEKDTVNGNFNGVNDLIVQLITSLKLEGGKDSQRMRKEFPATYKTKRPLISCGNYYLYPAKTRDCGEEYVYEIRNENGVPNFTAFKYGVKVFSGTPEQFLRDLPDLKDE
jgi:hypothetical protein